MNNYRKISTELGYHPTTIQRSNAHTNKCYPLIADLVKSSNTFMRMAAVHRLYEQGQPIPASMRADFIEYARKMNITPTISGVDKVALFSMFGDDITLSQVCDMLDQKQTVELWKINRDYTLKIKGGATISGDTVIMNNDSFQYCGDVSVDDVKQFNKF